MSREAFRNWLELFDIYNEFNGWSYDLSHATDPDEFLLYLQNESRGFIPFNYDELSCTATGSDHRMSNFHNSIVSLNVHKVVRLDGRVKPIVYELLRYTCAKIYSRANQSYFYNGMLDYYYEERILNLEFDDDRELVVEKIAHSLGSWLKSLKQFVKDTEDLQRPDINMRCKFTAEEKELIKCCNTILDFDFSVMARLIEANDYIDLWDGMGYNDRNETWNAYIKELGAQPIVEEFLWGNFVLDWNDDSLPYPDFAKPAYSRGGDEEYSLLNYYIDHVNAYESEGVGFHGFTKHDGKIVVTLDGVTVSKPRIRKKVLSYSDAFYKIEEIADKIANP